jgi:hypothetical protein
MKKYIASLISIIIFCSSCTTIIRKNYIVLLDNSNSIDNVLFDKYISVIQNCILRNMRKEDKLTLIFIDECSQTRAERIFSVDFSQNDFTNKMDGVNNAIDSSRARMGALINDSLVCNINSIIRQKKIERIDCGEYTDIISALKEASNLCKNAASFTNNNEKVMNNAIGNENYKYENCIVILSDMVNENALRTIDFRNYGTLTEADLTKKFEFINSTNNIADLNKALVLVYGATSSKEAGKNENTQIENIKALWKMYFKSAGATLLSYGFDTASEISDYTKNNK